MKGEVLKMTAQEIMREASLGKVFESEYDDFTLYTKGFKHGDKAWLLESGDVTELVVYDSVVRSEEMKAGVNYDALSDIDLMGRVDEYDCSGEFVTDDDIYYVFFDFVKESTGKELEQI